MDYVIRLFGAEVSIPGTPDMRQRPMHELRVCQVRPAVVDALLARFGETEGVLNVDVPQLSNMNVHVKLGMFEALRMGLVAMVRDVQRDAQPAPSPAQQAERM